jgi:6-phosphogluconate dehydrogenase
MAQAEIGLIGLGVMGANLALNIAEKGHTIAVYNRTAARTEAFMAKAGGLAPRLVPTTTLKDFVAAIRPPRPVIIMIQAGSPVDAEIAQLRPILSAGDIIIDAGNANFRDTMRRFQDLAGSGLTFIGMGVSGGEEGARHGPSIMVGGTAEAYARVEKVLTAIAARYHDEPCCAHLGSDGAGHFVKTIHNGIEYADMEMIAEVYGIMRDGLGLAPAAMADVFATWNKGRLNSYLIEITANVLAASDPRSGKPMVDVIVDSAGQKGTGRWAVIEAQMMGVPATAIEAAVAARSLSAQRDERQLAQRLYGRAVSPFAKAEAADLIRQLELALFAGKIAAYAQGFAVMEAASREFNWGLPMATIARIWRAGCIIRSQFLDTIASAYEGHQSLANLLQAPEFVAMMKEAMPALRQVVARAVTQAIPVSALAASLSYVDGYTQGRGTANLIQAQRDFFGAHGFERFDTTGPQHGPWGSGTA